MKSGLHASFTACAARLIHPLAFAALAPSLIAPDFAAAQAPPSSTPPRTPVHGQTAAGGTMAFEVASVRQNKVR